MIECRRTFGCSDSLRLSVLPSSSDETFRVELSITLPLFRSLNVVALFCLCAASLQRAPKPRTSPVHRPITIKETTKPMDAEVAAPDEGCAPIFSFTNETFALFCL